MSEILIENYIKEFFYFEDNKEDLLIEGRILDFFKKKLGFSPSEKDLSKVNKALKSKDRLNYKLDKKNSNQNLLKKNKTNAVSIKILTLLICFYLAKNNLEINNDNIDRAVNTIENTEVPSKGNKTFSELTPKQLSSLSTEEFALVLGKSSEVNNFIENEHEYKYDSFKNILSGKEKSKDYINYLQNLSQEDWRTELVTLSEFVQANSSEFDENDAESLRFLIAVFDSSPYNRGHHYSRSLKKILYLVENPNVYEDDQYFDVNEIPDSDLPNLSFDTDIFSAELGDDW